MHKAAVHLAARLLSRCRPLLNDRILILSPEKTKDKKIAKVLLELRTPQEQLKPVIRLIDNDEPGTLDEVAATSSLLQLSIEQFRPSEASVSRARANGIVKSMCSSFTGAQLRDYAKQANPDIKGMGGSKKKIVLKIMSECWHINVSSGVEGLDLLTTEAVALSELEMFLLLALHGIIYRHIKGAVAEVGFESGSLLLTGTPAQIENAKINLSLAVENCHREKIDLTSVKKLYEEKYGEFSIEEIGKNVEVYFNKLGGDTYELVSLSASQAKRMRRLLLWMLDLNTHSQRSLYLQEFLESAFLPYKDDSALQWKDRGKEYFVLRNDRRGAPLLHDKDDDWDLLRSLGLGDASEELESEFNKFSQRRGYEISSEQRDALFNQLTNFGFRKGLHGVADGVGEPVLTFTLGQVLFLGKQRGVLPAAPAASDCDYGFTSNVPLAYNQALRLPLVSEGEDPHSYALQIKFAPSPYVEELPEEVANTADEQVKYPPVEMWVQLGDNAVPDMSTLQVVSVEGENNGYVSLPEAPCDLKVSCQVTGNVIEEAPATGSSVAEQLEEPAYAAFRLQPGLVDFLQACQLDFGGHTQTKIAPFVDLRIGGRTVRYNYVSVLHRRELVFEEGVTVFVNIVEGGALGGRRLEVRFVELEPLSRAQFDRVLDYVLGFVGRL